MDIYELTQLPITQCAEFVEGLSGQFSERDELIARQIIKELRSRLGFLQDVGLNYLTLARGAASLSGGEGQRIRLATQIGSQLVGVLYVLDEPSIGLHQRDNEKLIETLLRLRDLGNTVLIVEHDEATIRAADWVVDLGPGAGEHGGHVVCEGTLDDILACDSSATGQYISGARSGARAAKASRGKRQSAACGRSPRQQPEEHRCRHPTGVFCRDHGRLRVGQEQPADGDRGKAPGAGT